MTRAILLKEYLSSTRTRRFKPGRHDCALFVAGWVMKLTGIDHAEQWRGYKSLKAGRAALVDAGFKNHVEYVASILDEIPPSMAQTGDIVAADRNAMGIVSSDRVFVLRHDGIGHISRMRAKRAFRV